MCGWPLETFSTYFEYNRTPLSLSLRAVRNNAIFFRWSGSRSASMAFNEACPLRTRLTGSIASGIHFVTMAAALLRCFIDSRSNLLFSAGSVAHSAIVASVEPAMLRAYALTFGNPDNFASLNRLGDSDRLFSRRARRLAGSL